MHGGKYDDDVSGYELIQELVKEARIEELKEVRKRNLYTKVPMQECRNITGRDPIGTRWVDTHKEDSAHPEYRSILVAPEIKAYKREAMFAATPPLEAKQRLLSLATTRGIGWDPKWKKSMKLDFKNVRRAYFHAMARRSIYVARPEEYRQEGQCGRLNNAMYGTRDAAQHWESAYIACVESVGFRKGRATPCVFYHQANNLRVTVHGVDFTVLGLEESLNWFRRMISNRYEVKSCGRIGPNRE